MVVRGSDQFLYSKEGVTQGDPLSMFMYAVSSVPLISSLVDDAGVRKQVWFADGASACGKFDSLREWFNRLKVRGPLFGYFPEPAKTFLVVDESCRREAEEVFEGSGVNVVCSHRLLGGIIGSELDKEKFLKDQIKKWVSDLECLTEIASSQPQVALAAFTKSLQFRWTYVQRVVSGFPQLFSDLEELIGKKFLPAILMSEVSEAERVLFSLSAKWGRLGVTNPIHTGDSSYLFSRKAQYKFYCGIY